MPSFAGKIVNGSMLSGILRNSTGPPFTMNAPPAGTGSELSMTVPVTPSVGLGQSMNGSGGAIASRAGQRQSGALPLASTPLASHSWKADLRLAKRFDLGEMRQLEILAESFNLFNHQNVTRIETTGYIIEPGSPPSTLGAPAIPPSLNFLTGLKTNSKTGLPSSRLRPAAQHQRRRLLPRAPD